MLRIEISRCLLGHVTGIPDFLTQGSVGYIRVRQKNDKTNKVESWPFGSPHFFQGNLSSILVKLCRPANTQLILENRKLKSTMSYNTLVSFPAALKIAIFRRVISVLDVETFLFASGIGFSKEKEGRPLGIGP